MIPPALFFFSQDCFDYSGSLCSHTNFRIICPAAAELRQSCPTLCDPTDGSPPGSPLPGILQARTLEWVAISFSNAWKWKVKVKSLSCVPLLVTPWTVAHQAPPSMGFSRQEYWSGVPSPSPNLALAYLNELWTVAVVHSWPKSTNTIPIFKKSLISHVKYWLLYRKWKTGCLYRYRMVSVHQLVTLVICGWLRAVSCSHCSVSQQRS